MVGQMVTREETKLQAYRAKRSLIFHDEESIRQTPMSYRDQVTLDFSLA